MKNVIIFLALVILILSFPFPTYANSINDLNEEELTFTNIKQWHQKGLKGDGVSILVNDIGQLDSSIPSFNGKIIPLYNTHKNKVEINHAREVVEIIHAIAPEATIYVNGTNSVNDGLKYALENKIQIVSQSLVGTRIIEGVDYSQLAYEKNIFLNVSSGNDPSYLNPYAKNEYWNSVGAVDLINNNPKRAYYSGYGEDLDVMGLSGIRQNLTGNITEFHGTSASTALVSGMLALYYQYYKEQNGQFPTVNQAREFMYKNTIDIEESGFDIYTGHGVFVLPNIK